MVSVVGLVWFLALALAGPSPVLASGSAPVIATDATRSLAFPAKDLSLFGRATDAEFDPLVVSWTMTSGPAPVVFSAPWALATTVTFTTPGSYTFLLTVSDGTSAPTASTTVTVAPSSSQTAFYVDPTYTGGTQNGAAATPWAAFQDGNPGQSAQWAAINTALASTDVIIYFSARQAGSDMAETMTGSSGPGSVVRIQRTDTSTHRLTLDGMSLYNTNDASPNWVAYTGTNKMHLQMTGGCCLSIGWDNDQQYGYVTIRGFEVSGSGARIRWGGDYSVLEYMWVHDVTALGATVQYNQAVTDGTCGLLGNTHDITIRGNLIERGIGEGIYVAGNYNYSGDGGCQTGPNGGDNHFDVLIEGNTVIDAGLNGPQGDGIDVKAGIYNVTIRGNLVAFTHSGPPSTCDGADGIATLGRMNLSTHESNYLIEQNIIHDGTCTNVGGPSHGIALTSLWGAVVRNNLIYTMPGTGIVAWSRIGAPTTANNRRLLVVNNTLDTTPGISFSDMDDVPTLRNNLVMRGGGIQGSVSSINSDYNLLAGATGGGEGAHSVVLGSAAGLVLDATTADFHLAPGSAARDMGLNLQTTGFAVDLERTPRPIGPAWDVGAYEGAGSLPAAPLLVRGLR